MGEAPVKTSTSGVQNISKIGYWQVALGEGHTPEPAPHFNFGALAHAVRPVYCTRHTELKKKERRGDAAHSQEGHLYGDVTSDATKAHPGWLPPTHC